MLFWAALVARSGDCGVEGGDSQQVVDGGGDFEPGSVAVAADVAQLASSGDRFDPAEGFLDPFSDPQADLVAAVAGRAPVDRGALPGRVLCDVRGEAEWRVRATKSRVS